jgi:hypothetical protein
MTTYEYILLLRSKDEEKKKNLVRKLKVGDVFRMELRRSINLRLFLILKNLPLKYLKLIIT